MKIILLAILVIGVAFTVWFFFRHSGKIREYKDTDGNAVSGSVSEKLKIEINGVMNGLIINSKNEKNPVLLFISSGPGTDDYFLNEKYPETHLEDAYTVCYWDYRGMGIVYDSDIDPSTITMDLIVDDAVAVTEYLKERFSKEKIYVMGFSGGTKIGVPLVQKHSELYYAYISMAQVVTNGPDNDTLIYNFIRGTFSARDDQRNLKKLDSLVNFNENGQVTCKNWYKFIYLLHKAGGGTTMNETEFVGIDIPIMMSHCYTVQEVFNFIRGMKMYRKTPLSMDGEEIDFRKTAISYEIPVFFLSGDHDYNCPWPLVKEYNDIISAPDKDFFLIKNAAHSPLWEQQEASFEIMNEIIDRTNGR